MSSDMGEGLVETLSFAGPEGAITALVAVPKEINADAPLAICVHGSGCTGKYFDLSVNSWLQASRRAGIPALALDRPGHGFSSRGTREPLSATRSAIEVILQNLPHGLPALAERRVVLVGHSFGGAAALYTAVHWPQRGMDLIGLCISGIGDIAHGNYQGATRPNDFPASYWLFGPGKTYDFRGVSALRPASTIWQDDEIAELRERWATRFPVLAKGVSVPTHIRLAEHERIWDASEEGVDRIARQFVSSPWVDSAILPDGGHLYEMHIRGPELVAEQLAFVRTLAGMNEL